MVLKLLQSGNLSFEYDESWEVEDPDTFNNPDCIVTLSKGENNLINVVAFPTETNLSAYKEFMEKTITEDGGSILTSDFIEIASMDAIRLHANIRTPEITFDIHTFVFIEEGNIYIFELRNSDYSSKSIKEYESMISTLKLE